MDWQEEDWRYRSEVSALMLVVASRRGERGEEEREADGRSMRRGEGRARRNRETLRGMEKQRRRRRRKRARAAAVMTGRPLSKLI